MADSVMPVIPFGECITTVDFTKITFQVNMEDITLNEGDYVWTYVRNTDEWPEMTDDDGDGIFTVEVNFEPGTGLEYFYAYGTWDIWDEEMVPAECSNEDGYRTYSVTGDDDMLPAYYYGTCTTSTGGIHDNAETFAIYPNPANECIELHLLRNIQVSGITVSDLSGKIVRRAGPFQGNDIRIGLQQLDSGVYVIQLNTIEGIYHHKVVVNH
jgi:hypothetical protein